MNQEERNILINLQIEKSMSMLEQVQVGLDNSMWDMVANRLYYAIFHAVVALLISRGCQVGTHKGAMIQFQQHFVRTGLFSKEEGHLYSRMQQLREESDYNCFIQTSEQEITPFVEPTKLLIEKIKMTIVASK